MAKICSRCDKPFHPTGKACKVCESCKVISYNLKRARVHFSSHLPRVFLRINERIAQEELMAQ